MQLYLQLPIDPSIASGTRTSMSQAVYTRSGTSSCISKAKTKISSAQLPPTPASKPVTSNSEIQDGDKESDGFGSERELEPEFEPKPEVSELRLRWPQQNVAPQDARFPFPNAQLGQDARLRDLYAALQDLNVAWEIFYWYGENCLIHF